VFGEGDIDVVLVPGFTTHIELTWEHEPAACADAAQNTPPTHTSIGSNQ
jgi:hypothetical protein